MALDEYCSSEYEEICLDNFSSVKLLTRDLRFLAGMPELCDVVFLVGENRSPVFGVKAVLAIRSRVFYKLLYGPQRRWKVAATGQNCSERKLRHQAVVNRSVSQPGFVGRQFQRIFSVDSLDKNEAANPHQPNFGPNKMVVQIDEFDVDVFRQLIEFLHTGSVRIVPNTVIGLMNAADHFCIEDLRLACSDFARTCISLDNVCSLLVCAERYIQYKSTKIFVQSLLDFVDWHAESVLCDADLVYLPQHVFQLLLSRDELRCSELAKWRAVQRWAANSAAGDKQRYAELTGQLVGQLALEEIPAKVLMTEIQPANLVAPEALMNALAFQADPRSADGITFARTPKSVRRRRQKDAAGHSSTVSSNSSGYGSQPVAAAAVDDSMSIRSLLDGKTLIEIRSPNQKKNTPDNCCRRLTLDKPALPPPPRDVNLTVWLRSKSVSDLTRTRIAEQF